MLHRRMFQVAAVVVCCALAISVGNARGYSRDAAGAGIAAPTDQIQARVGAPNAAELLRSIVSANAGLQAGDDHAVVPAATTVDQAEWVGNVLHIYLTVPAGDSQWQLTDTEMEVLSLSLAQPFRADDAFGGTFIHARAGTDQPYDNLEAFRTPRLAPAPVVHEPDEVPTPMKPVKTDRTGPHTHAVRQPTGALSGVTVFASAGHGWTAGDDSWYLQRPVLLGMTEDHGNIDMLNYFVQYAYNAGATVVPFRPVGWQSIEIVLDQDDPGVTYTNTWNNGTGGKYYENGVTSSGVPYKWISAEASQTATARYTPTITVTDFYPVFCFTPAGSNRTLQTYRVKHSGGISEITIDHSNVGSGWIWLGDYYLEAGGPYYVEITNESTGTGAIIADAMRWGGGMGDIERTSSSTISGYPRDEECQRYWAHSELGNNGVGFDSDIWDGGGTDGGDNVRTGAKWAREMNQVPAGGIYEDRWKRIHLEFHTNASSGAARGQITLITSLGETTYQEEYAVGLSNEFDADMNLLSGQGFFEHTWVDRSSPTYTSEYGAICTGANSDEFDATIIELAFHDQQDDAELLRDDRVRSAMARASLHGIIKFLNNSTYFPDTEVPLAFAPDTPRDVRIEDLGGGDALLSWIAPLSDAARGDPATGYVAYASTNGYGFGEPVTTTGLSVAISGLPLNETRYYRVAATNDGGESMPSEVVAIRRQPDGYAPSVLIVNGFDRLRRQQNPIQEFTQPPAYAGDEIERQIWRQTNSYDYAVQFAQALDATTVGFASCSNEAVIDYLVDLEDYKIVLWILGNESTEDDTLNNTEKSKLQDFLDDGGGLFISGAELAYDLIDQGGGTSFMADYLHVGYVADDAGTDDVAAEATGILSDVGTFDFDFDNGAAYPVYTPDELSTGADAVSILEYDGGTSGTAAVQYDAGDWRAVTFGFPFEAISSASKRADIMERIIEWLEHVRGPLPFDWDRDGDVDLSDYAVFKFCFQGPNYHYASGHVCEFVDGNGDLAVDMLDFVMFQAAFTGPL